MKQWTIVERDGVYVEVRDWESELAVRDATIAAAGDRIEQLQLLIAPEDKCDYRGAQGQKP